MLVELDLARHALLFAEHGEADGRGLRARLFPAHQLDSDVHSTAKSIIGRMKSRWSDAEATEYTGPLGPRVYTSRLLGRDKSLVLHGGGNTSVKLREKDVFGVERDVLYVKGSGSDLETISAAGFAPCRRCTCRSCRRCRRCRMRRC